MGDKGISFQILVIPNWVATVLENLTHYIALYVFRPWESGFPLNFSQTEGRNKEAPCGAPGWLSQGIVCLQLRS